MFMFVCDFFFQMDDYVVVPNKCVKDEYKIDNNWAIVDGYKLCGKYSCFSAKECGQWCRETGGCTAVAYLADIKDISGGWCLRIKSTEFQVQDGQCASDIYRLRSPIGYLRRSPGCVSDPQL